MGKQGTELRWWDQSSSSTVLLDPAALIESCKQQIQGKDGIPAEHQRLIFACRVANQEALSYTCKRSSRCPGTEENAVSEFLKELRGWEAILKDDNHNIAKLLHPLVRAEEQVAAEDERKASLLSCQTARELRSMGIPCNVYYLFFDKWIPASLKNGKCCEVMSNIEIQIDKDFQARSFQILLFGRLNGSRLPLPFVYRMNGGEVASQVDMLEQLADYRTRHRLALSTQSVGKGVEGRDGHTAVVEHDSLRDGNGCKKSELMDDYYCPCGKDLDFTVIISNDRNMHQLKCFVLKVIQVPADAGRKQEQLASHVSGRSDRGNSNTQHDSNKFRVSSAGATVSDNKTAFAKSLSAKCCPFSNESSQPRNGSEPSGSCSCPSDVPDPSYSYQSSISDLGTTPQNVYISSTESGPEEGLPVFEEPSGKVSKKKKKKRKGKRNGKLTTETCSKPASTPAVSAVSGSLDSCPQAAMVGCCSSCCEAACCSGSIGDETDARIQKSPVMQDIVRELSTCSAKNEGGLVNIFRRDILYTENNMEDRGGSTKRAEATQIGEGYLTAEEIIAEIVSDQKAMALSQESPKDSVGTNSVVNHGDESLPVGRDIPWSACGTGSGSCDISTKFRESHAVCGNADDVYMCTSTCLANNLSHPFLGPIMVEMAFQKPSGLPTRTSGDSRGSHYPSRELVGNLETVSDTNTLVDFSDTRFSVRGGYNGGSGTGSRNGRSGADGSGNRSNGRGSEDNRKGTSGYHGGGQGSSGSSHGSGPGGSSTSGGSGGSGGGNGNRGGGRGSSGGNWDGRRSDDDGANGSKEGDNDERYRNSFQAGSNGEAAADSLSRKKGVSSSDSHGTNNRRKGVTGDQLMNGTSHMNHNSLATSSSGGKENIDSWQKVQKLLDEDRDDLGQDSGPPSRSTTGSEGSRTWTDEKVCPPSTHINGFLLPPTKESSLMEKRDGADLYPHGRADPTQDSLVKVLKQSSTDSAHHKDDDHLSSSSSWSSKDNRSSGTIVLGQQESLKGAWQKKISWDDHRQPSYTSKYLPEATSHLGPSKGKLYVKPPRNGIQMRGSQSPDSETVSHTKSSSAPSTPNSSQDSFTESRAFNDNYSMRPTDGHVYQLAGVQARMQVSNIVAVRQPGETRSLPEERLTMWKSRKSSAEQERPPIRDKLVGDRERTTHWAQKWVPVEHKSGGASGKGSASQANSSSNIRPGVPPDGNSIESNGPQQVSVNFKEGEEEDSRKADGPPSSSELPPRITSSSKSLRRLQTFPFGNVNALLRVAGSEVDVLEIRESVASVASERPCGHAEQPNLRGLLPKARTVDNPPTQAAAQNTVGGHSTSVQSPIPGEHKNKLRLDDRSSMVKPVLSPAKEESKRVAMAILDAVQSSCRDRRAAEVIVREVGCPMAEFEKVLGAVAPSFFPVVDSDLPTSVLNEMEGPSVSCSCKSRGHSTYQGEEFSICRCRVSHMPLKSIWQWYEEPSYYGVEVGAVDSDKVRMNRNEEEQFLAYFVPYLSGLQIFGYSSDSDSRRLGELATAGGHGGATLSSQPKVFSGSDMLATLFPSPGKSYESLSHVRPTRTTFGQNESCFRDKENCGIQLLYEFYDADLPQVRQPLFTKVKELVEGVTSFNSYSRGDPAVLDGLCLGDIHPVSWFAVAWYPIYRISEGPLRAVFLTYHSFNHFAPRSSLSCLMGGTMDVDDSISMPVVGLECYNLQGEPWLSMGGRFSEEAGKESAKLSGNPVQYLENRITSLQEVAAGMAKGIPDDKSAGSADGSSSSNKFRHSDYEFFVKRRR